MKKETSRQEKVQILFRRNMLSITKVSDTFFKAFKIISSLVIRLMDRGKSNSYNMFSKKFTVMNSTGSVLRSTCMKTPYTKQENVSDEIKESNIDHSEILTGCSKALHVDPYNFLYTI